MKNSPWSWRPGGRSVPAALLITALLLLVQPVAQGQSFSVPVLPGADAPQQQTIDVEPASIQWYVNLPPTQPGFPVALSGAYLIWGSSPTLVDLDGDGKLEIVLAGRDLVNGSPGNGGMVYAYRANGALFWQKHVRAPVNSTPTAADLNGDGHPDIVVSMGGFSEAQHWNGGVTALNGLDGQEFWTFDTQDWLNHSPDGWLDGVFSTPAVGDINGDGQLEITFGAWDQCIYLLDRAGQPLWGNLPGVLPDQIRCGGHGFYNEDTIWSSPALADITGDGRLEIIIGADIAPGNVWGDPGGGYLYILDADGNTLAREWMDQTVFSSPAVADLDNDGASEFVVGTGTYWANRGYYVSAFDYNPAGSDPTQRLVLKWRKPTTGRVFASPALADLNGDRSVDVVITALTGDWGEDGTFVYAWRGSDGAALFQRRVCDMWGNSGNTLSSPTISDVDGDNRPEILLSHQWEVEILNHDGTYYTDYSNPQYTDGPNHPGCARDHQPTTSLTYWAKWSLYASPAVGDLDGDGDAEIVIGGHNPDNSNQGMIFAWTGLSTQINPPWPTWRHDEHHTGNLFFETTPPTNPTSLESLSHLPEDWSTANSVEVAWSGAADKDSGVAGYSVVWDKVPNTLPDQIMDLAADVGTMDSPPLPDGNGHYFHLRTVDRAGNWTADAVHVGPFWIDTTPPLSRASSPGVVTGSFQVTWAGSDATSGVSHYSVEVSDNGGPWNTWLHDQTGTSATYQGSAGHVYRFRSIAYDRAGNREADFSAAGDTATAVAKYLLSGTVYDQRGAPVRGASVVAQPSALNTGSTSVDGQFTLGLADGGMYALTASQPLLGARPPMKGISVNSHIDGMDLFLPPASNLIQNGDFESSGSWQTSGAAPIEGAGHTGDYALGMGNQQPPSPGTWTASQTVSVPRDATEVTLDWCYRIEGDAASHDEFVVTVRGASAEESRPLSLQAAGWAHDWMDLSRFAGQEVVVTFGLSRQADDVPLTVWLDEVGLGTGRTSVVYLPHVLKSR